MMNPSKQTPISNSGAARLPLRLAGLFALAFALFFVLFFAYDLLSGFAERSAMSVQVNEQAKPIVIDPKLADDLAKVLALDANPNSEDVRDPFSDRAGLSGTVAAATLQAMTTTPAGSSAAASGPRVSSIPGSPSGLTISAPATASPIQTTKERYDIWDARVAKGADEPLDPRIFGIEDLKPVGIVDGGDGKQEVLFCYEEAFKTLSFPLGTMFFDGWLAELQPNGVVFSSNDGRRTVSMRRWTRSLKNAGCNQPYVNPLTALKLEDLQKLVLIKELSRGH